MSATRPDPVASEAIAWAVRLGSGEASTHEREAYAAWRRQDPRHEAAAARIEHSLQLFSGLPETTETRSGVRRTLLAPPRRHALKGMLGLGLLALGSGAVLHRSEALPQWLADASTDTGERRQIALPDGSRLWLNARSAVDLDFGPNRRDVHLRAGEIIADVAPGLQRPLTVHCAYGRVQTHDARVLLRNERNDVLVSVLRAAVSITPLRGAETQLTAEHSARFDAVSVRPDATVPRHATAWEDGFIELHNRPLEDIVTALRAYRPGVLRISPQAAQLRVTGSFSLDDSEATLTALAETLPITLLRRTAYWTSIETR